MATDGALFLLFVPPPGDEPEPVSFVPPLMRVKLSLLWVGRFFRRSPIEVIMGVMGIMNSCGEWETFLSG